AHAVELCLNQPPRELGLVGADIEQLAGEPPVEVGVGCRADRSNVVDDRLDALGGESQALADGVAPTKTRDELTLCLVEDAEDVADDSRLEAAQVDRVSDEAVEQDLVDGRHIT